MILPEGRARLARALNDLLADRPGDAATALLDRAARAPRPEAHVVGVTGPPGVGKSTLVGRLLRLLRSRGRTVAVLAVDPSSPRSGGALLGDRVRMTAGPALDDGVFIRSLASRDRQGGLGPGAFEATLLLRAAADRVLVETVGAGQAEIDVAGLADTTLVLVQPAAGDLLQHRKSGLMEVPDVVAVTKSDLGAAARRSVRELRAAMPAGTPVLAVSASTGEGLEELVRVLELHRAAIEPDLAARRARQLRAWVVSEHARRRGTAAVEDAGGRKALLARLAALGDEAPPSALVRALEGS